MALPSDFAEKYGPWALVTGSSAGMGAEYARQLAATGLNIVLVARRKSLMDKIASSISEEYNVQTRCIAEDLSSSAGCDAVRAACDDIEVGLLVNNAGIALNGSFFRDDETQHRKLVDLNCTAVVSLSHSFGRLMIERKRGGIIFMSSVMSSPMPYFSTYCASKSFVSCFAKTLREELGKYGVSATVIEPGAVDTDMSREAGKNIDFAKGGFASMSAEQCITEALAAFAAGRASYIPGVKNKVSMSIMRSIPDPISIKLGNVLVGTMMNPEIMKPS